MKLEINSKKYSSRDRALLKRFSRSEVIGQDHSKPNALFLLRDTHGHTAICPVRWRHTIDGVASRLTCL